MAQEQKSVVALLWYNTKNASVTHMTTGFIFKKNNQDGIFILSVSEFISKLPKEELQTTIPKDEIGVKVAFFDLVTQMDARVLNYDLDINLAVLYIKACDKFNNHPLPCIQAASMSTDPTYQGQSIKAIHHPQRFEVHNGKPTLVFNQLTKGFVADSNYLNGELVHFSLPLIFRGSVGAPVFDKHSNRVVSMIQKWESGQRDSLEKPYEVSFWCDVQNRYLGLPVAKIIQFLEKAPDAVSSNPPI